MSMTGPWVPLVAAVIFLVFAYFTRTPWPRIAAALAGGLVFGLLNIACDLLGHKLHWWWYPAFGGRGYGALEWYIAAALVPGAAFGLVGWRVHRRWGVRGLSIFLFAFATLGMLRDWRWASRAPDLIVFGSGATPWIADYAAWFTLAGVVQLVHFALRGNPKREALARSRV